MLRIFLLIPQRNEKKQMTKKAYSKVEGGCIIKLSKYNYNYLPEQIVLLMRIFQHLRYQEQQFCIHASFTFSYFFFVRFLE